MTNNIIGLHMILNQYGWFNLPSLTNTNISNRSIHTYALAFKVGRKRLPKIHASSCRDYMYVSITVNAHILIAHQLQPAVHGAA